MLQEFVSFYRKQFKDYYDLKGLDQNFSVALPLRRHLPFDSMVRFILIKLILEKNS